MKKLVHLTILLILFNFLSYCGYSPIFKAENLKFNVAEYSLEGDKKIGNKILSDIKKYSNKSDDNSEKLNFLINSSKTKEATIKNSSGKILEYKVTIKVSFQIINLTADNALINNSITQSTNFSVKDQYSETRGAEKKAVDNLLQKTNHHRS